MKFIVSCLLLIVGMVVPYHSYAATEGVYVTAGISSFKLDNLTPSYLERNVLNIPNTIARFTSENKSTNNELGVGYCMNKYFCAEMSYTHGITIKTSTKVTSLNNNPIDFSGTTINLNGTSYVVPSGVLGNQNTTISLDRDGEASALRYSLSGEYPLSERISILGRIGVYHWRATIVDKISVDNSGVYLSFNEYQKGKDPMASIGVNLKLTEKADVGIEYLHIKKITMTSITARYWF